MKDSKNASSLFILSLIRSLTNSLLTYDFIKLFIVIPSEFHLFVHSLMSSCHSLFTADLTQNGDCQEDPEKMASSSRVASADSDKSASNYNPGNQGPIKKRGCTDIICLLLFIAFLIGWIVIGIYGFANGNPISLVYPSDSNGEICGRGDLEDRPYLFFFDITKCLRPSSVALGCPTKQVIVHFSI
jgi:hypothetical protein